jgi:hypothetical protein
MPNANQHHGNKQLQREQGQPVHDAAPAIADCA